MSPVIGNFPFIRFLFVLMFDQRVNRRLAGSPLGCGGARVPMYAKSDVGLLGQAGKPGESE